MVWLCSEERAGIAPARKEKEVISMRKWQKGLVMCLVGAMLTLTGCASAPKEPQQAAKPEEQAELLVSAAASLTDVLAELKTLYAEQAPDTVLTFTFGSSGALQSQIEEGAPADVFISAGQKQMDALADEGLLAPDSRRDLLVNEVVLIVPQDSDLALTSFADAAEEPVKRIALGDPAGVPVGQYSEAVFTYLGLWDDIKAKAVFASDVRQVLTWVETGEVDCGVVYATDAAISEAVQVVCQAPEGSHPAVIYPVAVLKDSKQAQAAQAFVDFLATEEAAAVFERYGFTMQ